MRRFDFAIDEPPPPPAPPRDEDFVTYLDEGNKVMRHANHGERKAPIPEVGDVIELWGSRRRVTVVTRYANGTCANTRAVRVSSSSSSAVASGW